VFAEVAGRAGLPGKRRNAREQPLGWAARARRRDVSNGEVERVSETDVIRAFLDGGELSEAALRTDGKQLFSNGRLIAEKRGGKLHVVENAIGPLGREHRTLLLDFVQWREQRAKVLRRLLRAKEMPALRGASGARAFSACSKPARSRGEV